MQTIMTDRAIGLSGDRLRRARERMHLSQEELAAALGTQQQAIQRWEKERVEPNSVTLKQMADVLRVTTDYLLGLSDEPSTYREFEELTPELRKLIFLAERGLTIEAIEVLTGLAKKSDQS
jgi:transcriptional regulator with XRE-family HTH domain